MTRLTVPIGVLGGLLLLPPWLAPAQGQVSVDMRALDPGGTSANRPPATHTSPVIHPGTVTHSGSTEPRAKAPPPHVTASSRSKETAPAPVQNPPAAVSEVPALPRVEPAAPPPSATIPAPAPGPEKLPPPVRLVFEEGKTDLTPDAEAVIKELARSIPMPALDSVNVMAYAAGKPDDPSTARRVSLTRGMAVRSVLLASGVPSAQIYVRALGATPSDGPADRVELIVAPIGGAVPTGSVTR